MVESNDTVDGAHLDEAATLQNTLVECLLSAHGKRWGIAIEEWSVGGIAIEMWSEIDKIEEMSPGYGIVSV